MLMSESPLQLPPGFHCPACDYDLSGRALTGETRCSECGRVVERADLPKFEEWSLADRQGALDAACSRSAGPPPCTRRRSSFGAFWCRAACVRRSCSADAARSRCGCGHGRENGSVHVWAVVVVAAGTVARCGGLCAVSSAARGLRGSCSAAGTTSAWGSGRSCGSWCVLCWCIAHASDRLYRIGTHGTSRSMLTLIVRRTRRWLRWDWLIEPALSVRSTA